VIDSTRPIEETRAQLRQLIARLQA